MLRPIFFLLLVTPFFTSFVLLGKKEQRLPVHPESPTAVFHWSSDNKAPKISGKEKIREGIYAELSDEQLIPILVQEAMNQWNQVRGSYLRLQMTVESGELNVDETDRVNNMVVKTCSSATVAAYAAPHSIDKDSETSDCDVVICNVSTSASSLLETLTHELGHCVGLGHPHTNYNSIMSYSRSGSSYKLSADDKAGAIFLYPDPNVVDEESKDLISCGSIRGLMENKQQGPLLYLFLALPLVFIFLGRSLGGKF